MGGLHPPLSAGTSSIMHPYGFPWTPLPLQRSVACRRKRIERARLQAGSRPIRAAGSRRARSLLASHARPGHLATSKGTSWARARLATRDFLARPAGGPHAKMANGAPRSGTKSGARSAAAAQVLGMGHVRAMSTSNALTSPPVAPLADGCELRARHSHPSLCLPRVSPLFYIC